jgi:hypothetical protein
VVLYQDILMGVFAPLLAFVTLSHGRGFPARFACSVSR